MAAKKTGVQVEAEAAPEEEEAPAEEAPEEAQPEEEPGVNVDPPPKPEIGDPIVPDDDPGPGPAVLEEPEPKPEISEDPPEPPPPDSPAIETPSGYAASVAGGDPDEYAKARAEKRYGYGGS